MAEERPAVPNPFDVSALIRTERLDLRPLEPGDLDAVHAYQSREDVCRYLLYEPRDRETLAAKLREWTQRRRIEYEGDFLQLAVIRREDGVLVGEIYFVLKSVADATAEIGWVFSPEHGGRGYATEAATAMLGVAFEDLRLHRVFANLDPRNEASVRLCLRLGMRHEAHHVEDVRFKGEWADTGIYAILDREFAR